MNETLFFGIDHARDAVARWTHSYNTGRPHSALGYQAPAAFAAQLIAMGDQLSGDLRCFFLFQTADA